MTITITAEGLMTDNERHARHMFASRAGRSKKRYSVVRAARRGVWYDFYCPLTDTFGQCRLREDWSWEQAPRGESPVLLVYKVPHKCK